MIWLSKIGGCCFALISLRDGAQVFAWLCIFYNITFVFVPPSLWTWPAPILGVVAGVFGIYGIHKNNPSIVKKYLAAYTISSIANFTCELIRVFYDREGMVRDTCFYSQRYQVCYAYNIEREQISLIMSSITYIIFVIWVIVLTVSFIQVLELGGDGREFVSPKLLKLRMAANLYPPVHVRSGNFPPRPQSMNGMSLMTHDSIPSASTVVGNTVDVNTVPNNLYLGVQPDKGAVVVGVPVKADARRSSSQADYSNSTFGSSDRNANRQ